MEPRVLIADDQPQARAALQVLLNDAGFISESVSSPSAVIEAVQAEHFDVLLVDLHSSRKTGSGRDGLQLLSEIRQIDSTLPVVLMTGPAGMDLPEEAVEGPGRDFVQKPWSEDQLLHAVRRQVHQGRLLRERKKELEVVRAIQRGLMLAPMSEVTGCDIHAYRRRPDGAGVDYFDAIRSTDSKGVFCMAELAAGKGLAAALLMTDIQATVRGLAGSGSSPAEMCRQLNRIVLAKNQPEHFISFFCAIVDSSRGTLRYCNAGLVAPLLVRRDGTVERLSQRGLLLGMLSNTDYVPSETSFTSGDRLLLISGVTDREEELNPEQIGRVVREHRSTSGERERGLWQAGGSVAAALKDPAAWMLVSMRP